MWDRLHWATDEKIYSMFINKAVPQMDVDFDPDDPYLSLTTN